MRITGFVIVVVGCLAAAAPTCAEMGNLEFRPIGENRGLDVAMPVDMLVDSRGYLWIGSRTGLYRYDGYRASLFEPDPNDPASITDLDIRALYEDSDGIIWVATNTGGLNRLDPETGTFSHFRHEPDNPSTITHDSVYGMREGPDGDLWAGTQIGLSRLNRNTDEIRRYLNDPADPSSLSGNYVFTVYRDSRNVLWIATIGGGLSRYNAAADDFTKFDLEKMSGGNSSENDVFAIAEDAVQNLWIGTRSGLFRLHSDRVTLEAIDLSGSTASQPVVTELLMGNDGDLWVGTLAQGLVRLDPESKAFRIYTDYNRSEPGGIAAQPILSLAMIDDLLFLGTWGGGLWATRLPDADFTLHGVDLPSTGLRLKNVTTLLAGTRPGQPLVGTFGGGLQSLDVTASAFAALPGEMPEHAAAGVLALARMADGHVFAATTSELIELDAGGTPVNDFHHDPAIPGSLGEGYVASLAIGPDDTLWVGVGGSGLYRLERASGTFTRFAHDVSDPATLSGDYIAALIADGEKLWVGTRSNGLNLCSTSPFSCQVFSDTGDDALRLGHFHVTALHRDARGRTWVATDGGGLHQVLKDDAGNVTGFHRWTEQDGLISDAIMAIESDSDGSLWLSTRAGLSRLDPDQGRVVSYVSQSGLPVSYFNAAASARDADYLYFGSVEGVLTIPRGLPFETRKSSLVRITAVEKIGSEPVKPGTGWIPATFTGRYRDILAIRFATLDYAEVPHEYQFRLEDGAEWSSLGRRNEVTLLNLAPRRYHFTARGRDIFGLWNTSEPLEIEVVPPFWMSTWFRLLLVAAVLLMAFGAHRLRTRRLKNMAREIERLGARREQALEEALGGKSELAGLTPRQKEVLQLIAEGRSTREIAERLDVSIKTVETHRAHLMDRLDIHDVAGLVRLAIRARLVSPHE